MKTIEFAMEHGEALVGFIQFVIVVLASIWSVVMTIKNKGLKAGLAAIKQEKTEVEESLNQHKDSLEEIIHAVGFKKGENKELKQTIEKKTSRRGLLGFLNSKVKELKRRNKTFRVLSDTAEDVAEVAGVVAQYTR
jgi:chromosome segregation ATPase